MKNLVVKMLLLMCMGIGLMGCQKKDTENLIQDTQAIEAETEVTEQIEAVSTEISQTEAAATETPAPVLQEWQKEYAKVLLDILAKTDRVWEYSEGYLSEEKFELIDVNQDSIPELWVGDVLFFNRDNFHAGVRGIKTDTNQLIWRDEYDIYGSTYVASVNGSEIKEEFVFWEDYDTGTYHISYDMGTNVSTISKEEFDELAATYDSSTLRQLQGTEITLDNIENSLKIEFGGYDKEFLALLLENEKSFDQLEYAQIYLDNNDIPEYVLNDLGYSFEIYIHDGEKYHVLGDGSSDGERIDDNLSYGTHSSSYSYYEKQGVLSYFAVGDYGAAGESFYKLNDNYELEYYFDSGLECEANEDGEIIEIPYCYNFYEHEKGVYEKYETIYQELGDGKDMVYEAEEMGYTNAIDLIVGNIKAI